MPRTSVRFLNDTAGATMKLAKVRLSGGKEAVAVVEGDTVKILPATPEHPTLAHILEAPNPAAAVGSLVAKASAEKLSGVELLAPIDEQEVWAAGVTYRRSQVARMEESQGAASFYDLVYAAPRPELFFKATPHRVAGPGQSVRIRQDARWNVPEPELALVINSRLELVGYTIGNDMSSRDIEGENPLYLPQAKLYDASCGLGPWIVLASTVADPQAMTIELSVERAGKTAFQGGTSVAQMARSFDDLINWLGRDNSFPRGVILLTGTGVVPGDDFTLQAGDLVKISISGIGRLSNSVVQKGV